MELNVFVQDFDHSICWADAQGYQAINTKSKETFLPGIGPHTESQTVTYVMQEWGKRLPERYGRYSVSVPYPHAPRRKCDRCLGEPLDYAWSIEIKMSRLPGDNGKLNDNILKYTLSPHQLHRSALADCIELSASGFDAREAILIYGVDHDEWPLDLAVEAFEALVSAVVQLGSRNVASFDCLIHPIHERGRVFAWEASPRI